jgi:hypothetical protein
MKYAFAAVFAVLIFWVIKPSNSPTNLNNSSSTAITATAKATAKPAVQRTEAKPVTVEPVGETAKVTEAAVKPQPEPEPQSPPLNDKEQLMQEAGIPQSDWGAVDYIVSHESSWNAEATNPSSGSHGLCQALPASKMASAGTDYMTNPVTQLRWCHQYAQSRYSGWWSAFASWKNQQWW